MEILKIIGLVALAMVAIYFKVSRMVGTADRLVNGSLEDQVKREKLRRRRIRKNKKKVKNLEFSGKFRKRRTSTS